FERDDFPLPDYSKTLAEIRDEIENGRGVALIKGLDIDKYSPDEIRIMYWGISKHLGTPICHNAHGDILGEVTDRGFDRKNNNVRGYTTKGAQNFHCDPMDVVGLLCIHPAKKGGESRFASSIAIYNHLLEHHPAYLDFLCEGFHYDLRGEGITGERDEVTFNRVPVFSWYEGRMSARYNGKTIIDGMRKAGKSLTDEQIEMVESVRNLAATPEFCYDMIFEKGDLQILSNYNVLHSRNSFEDWPEEHRHRRLLRIWLNVYNGRPLHPDFATRHNTGPRGGIMRKEGAGYWSDEKYYAGKNTPAE
ncbi:MAG: TauD/TfdA family dioxygenase, partial [Rhodospirillales bacterium]